MEMGFLVNFEWGCSPGGKRTIGYCETSQRLHATIELNEAAEGLQRLRNHIAESPHNAFGQFCVTLC